MQKNNFLARRKNCSTASRTCRLCARFSGKITKSSMERKKKRQGSPSEKGTSLHRTVHISQGSFSKQQQHIICQARVCTDFFPEHFWHLRFPDFRVTSFFLGNVNPPSTKIERVSLNGKEGEESMKTRTKEERTNESCIPAPSEKTIHA